MLSAPVEDAWRTDRGTGSFLIVPPQTLLACYPADVFPELDITPHLPVRSFHGR